MGERLKNALKILIPTVVIFLLGSAGGVHAERGDAASQQQELQKALEMLKGQGMDPKTQKQMEDMFKNMSEMGAKQQATKLKMEQQKFEMETMGHGTAQVEVDGKRYELKMTECKITDRKTGHFAMHARQAPGMGKGELWVGGGGGHSGNTIGFSSDTKGLYENSGNPTFQLNGKTLEWEGQMSGDKGKVSLKLRLTCGAEMVDYATPSKPNPEASVNVLTLQMDEETNAFQAGYCSTKEYRSGNLMVEFDATATGKFRGRPAIVLLSKSHPVETTQTFQNMDLLLGELTPEQRLLSPLKVAEQLRDKVNSYTNREMAAIQKKYAKETAAIQKKYGKDIPQDKMAEAMEAYSKVSDEQSKEMDKVQEQAKAMRYPEGRSFGAITVKGQEIHFGGSKLSTQDAHQAPEFQDLPAKTELWVTCGQ